MDVSNDDDDGMARHILHVQVQNRHGVRLVCDALGVQYVEGLPMEENCGCESLIHGRRQLYAELGLEYICIFFCVHIWN